MYGVCGLRSPHVFLLKVLKADGNFVSPLCSISAIQCHVGIDWDWRVLFLVTLFPFPQREPPRRVNLCISVTFSPCNQSNSFQMPAWPQQSYLSQRFSLALVMGMLFPRNLRKSYWSQGLPAVLLTGGAFYSSTVCLMVLLELLQYCHPLSFVSPSLNLFSLGYWLPPRSPTSQTFSSFAPVFLIPPPPVPLLPFGLNQVSSASPLSSLCLVNSVPPTASPDHPVSIGMMIFKITATTTTLLSTFYILSLPLQNSFQRSLLKSKV